MSNNDNSDESGDSVIDNEVFSRFEKLNANHIVKTTLHAVFSLMLFFFIFFIWYKGDNVDKMNKASFMILLMHIVILSVIDYQLSKLKEDTDISLIPPTEEGFLYLSKNVLTTLKSWSPLIILFIALYVFPGWLIPFSNTFGYAFSYRYYGDVLNDVIKQPAGINSENKMGKILAKKFEYDGYKNLFMNLLSKNKSLEGLTTTLNQIQKDMDIFDNKLFDKTEDGKPSIYLTKLHESVRMKDVVSRLIWMALTIILCNFMHSMYSNDLIYTLT